MAWGDSWLQPECPSQEVAAAKKSQTGGCRWEVPARNSRRSNQDGKHEKCRLHRRSSNARVSGILKMNQYSYSRCLMYGGLVSDLDKETKSRNKPLAREVSAQGFQPGVLRRGRGVQSMTMRDIVAKIQLGVLAGVFQPMKRYSGEIRPNGDSAA